MSSSLSLTLLQTSGTEFTDDFWNLLQLCLDIYLVRESNEFALEEDLFAKLVFLYRSPETIIKWTRERDDTDEEDDGENSPVPSIAN